MLNGKGLTKIVYKGESIFGCKVLQVQKETMIQNQTFIKFN